MLFYFYCCSFVCLFTMLEIVLETLQVSVQKAYLIQQHLGCLIFRLGTLSLQQLSVLGTDGSVANLEYIGVSGRIGIQNTSLWENEPKAQTAFVTGWWAKTSCRQSK